MSEHLSDSTLRQLLQGALGAGLADADRHLFGCDLCRQRLGAQLAAPELIDAVRLETNRHLTYEQIEGLHGGTLSADERTAAEDHLAVCTSCEREVKDFRTFADELARPMTRAADDSPRETTVSVMTLLDRLVDRFGMPPLAVAGAAVVLLVVLSASLSNQDPEMPVTPMRIQPDAPAAPAPVAPLAPVSRLERALARLEDSGLIAERRFRIRRILEGLEVPRRDDRVVTPDEAASWPDLRERYREYPLLVGAIAQDLGLTEEARAAYLRELQEDPDSEIARRLIAGAVSSPGIPSTATTPSSTLRRAHGSGAPGGTEGEVQR